MSQLIKALARAAKDRKEQAAAAGSGSDAPTTPGERNRQLSLEAPEDGGSGVQPPRRTPAERSSPSSSTGDLLDLEEIDVADSGGASVGNAAKTARDARTERSLAAIDAQDLHARAPHVESISRAGSVILTYFRSNPMAAFGAAAGFFAIGFGVYVYLQIAHPSRAQPPATAAADKGAAPVPAAIAEPAPGSTVSRISPEESGLTPGEGLPGLRPPPPLPAVAAPAAPLPAPLPAPALEAAIAPAAATSDPPLRLQLTLVLAAPPNRLPTASAATERLSPAPVPARQAMPADDALAIPPATTPRRLARAAQPPAPGTRTRRERAVSSTNEAAAAATDRIAISTTAAPPRVNPTLVQAYSALRAGNLDESRALYSKLLEAEPRNVDAMLGLAYVAVQQSRNDDAAKIYMRILQINPRNSTAQAALIDAFGRGDATVAESRLKQLIAYDASAFLHFVLGNLYAEQVQWSQAQRAYFQAHRIEADNPEYAYNLAVALDHIGQQKLALGYYRTAERLANATGSANFNVADVRKRIAALAPTLD